MRLFNQNTFDILSKFIRYYDNEIKILALSILVNILFKCDIQSQRTNENFNYIPIIWGLSILTNLIQELKLTNSKINSLKIISKVFIFVLYLVFS